MRIARLISGSCLVVLLCAVFGSAAGSDVADAAMRRNAPALRSLLQQKADVNAPQPDGATALHWAVQFDDVEMVQLLIRAGANVKAANRFGVTPLSLACVNGNAAIVERLLKAGAEVNALLSELGETALMMAARSGDANTVRVLLDNWRERERRGTLEIANRPDVGSIGTASRRSEDAHRAWSQCERPLQDHHHCGTRAV